MRPELGILADDLTGATDAGLQFAKYGLHTCVCLTWPAIPSCDVLVVDVDSRNRPAAEARDRVAAATASLRAAGATYLYKKIDSTGRGNLGAEIEGAVAAAEATAAVVCPAFPELGRTVSRGQIHVRGIPLDQTEFAADPIWPATTASLAAILRRQTCWQVDHVSLADVRLGPMALGARLGQAIARGARIVVVDAETTGDLRCLAEALRQAPERILPVGSAGLAEWLGAAVNRPAYAPKPLALGAGPIFVVAGTMNRVGVDQLARLLDRGAGHARLEPERALDDPDLAVADAALVATNCLRTNRRVVLTLADPRGVVVDVREIVRGRRLDPASATERLTRALASAAIQAIAAVSPAALILTGGDTARAVCAALQIQALEIGQEAAPGVPISRLKGGRWDGLTVVTKAGGFGDAETLARVVERLEEMQP